MMCPVCKEDTTRREANTTWVNSDRGRAINQKKRLKEFFRHMTVKHKWSDEMIKYYNKVVMDHEQPPIERTIRYRGNHPTSAKKTFELVLGPFVKNLQADPVAAGGRDNQVRMIKDIFGEDLSRFYPFKKRKRKKSRKRSSTSSTTSTSSTATSTTTSTATRKRVRFTVERKRAHTKLV